MASLTFDQIRLLLTVDEGSFSKASKKLNRAQLAVTYGIRKLEAQTGLPLFDRAAYRPALTEAGRTLLLRARRIAKETNAFRDTARSLASGLEVELTIAGTVVPSIGSSWMSRSPSPVGLKNAVSSKYASRIDVYADRKYVAALNDSPLAAKVEKPRISRKVATTSLDCAVAVGNMRRS